MLGWRKSDTEKREIDMSPENRPKFRIKVPEIEPLSPLDKDNGELIATTKPVFKPKDASYRDKLAHMRPDIDEQGKETGTNKLHFNVKGSGISSEIGEKTSGKIGFLSKISKLKRKQKPEEKKEEAEKKKISFRSKKDKAEQTKSRESSKIFKLKNLGEGTQSYRSPMQLREKVAFKQKEKERVKETVVKEKVAFKQKEQERVKETIVKEKVAFKQKERERVKETVVKENIAFRQKESEPVKDTVAKEKISFKRKERTEVEKTPSQKENTDVKSKEEHFSEVKKIERLKEDTGSKLQIVTGDTADSTKETPYKKEKITVSSFQREKTRSTSIGNKSKFGGLFSSYILNGIVLCIFTIGATYILSSIKNSPDSSIMWKICFVPQIFLVYVLILVIMYVTSLTLAFIGIHKKFKEG